MYAHQAVLEAQRGRAFLWAPGVIAPGYIVTTYKEPIYAFIQNHEWLMAALMFLIALAQGLPNLVLFGPLLILFVGLGVDFGIQFGVRYRAERHAGHDLERAIVAAAGGIGPSLTLAAFAGLGAHDRVADPPAALPPPVVART